MDEPKWQADMRDFLDEMRIDLSLPDSMSYPEIADVVLSLFDLYDAQRNGHSRISPKN